MTKKRYRSDALKAVHEMMEDLHKVGLVDNRTMRRFDKGCFMPRGSDVSKDSLSEQRRDKGQQESK